MQRLGAVLLGGAHHGRRPRRRGTSGRPTTGGRARAELLEQLPAPAVGQVGEVAAGSHSRSPTMNPTGVRRSTAGEGRAAAVRRCSSRRRGRPPSPTATTVPSSTIPPRGARPVSGSASSGNDGVTSRPFTVRSRSRSGRTCARQRSPSQANSTTQSLPSGSGPERREHRRHQLGHRGRAHRAGGCAEPAPPAPAPRPRRPTARHGAHRSRSVTGGRRTAASPSPNGRPPAPDSAAGRTIGL